MLRKSLSATQSSPQCVQMPGTKRSNMLDGLGFREVRGYCFGGSNNKDYSVLRSRLGSPCLRKLPDVSSKV